MGGSCLAERLAHHVRLTAQEREVLERLENQARSYKRGTIIQSEHDNGRELFIVPPVSATNPGADPAALAGLVNTILDDPAAAREAVSANARRFIEEHFTIDAVAERHLEVLQDLVRETSRGGRTATGRSARSSSKTV